MKYLFLILTLAYVTQYGWTGNKMANGKYPQVGSVACPRNIHLGTRVRIENIVYSCDDRTNLRYNSRFDIFSTGTKQEMMRWGKKRLNVKVL